MIPFLLFLVSRRQPPLPKTPAFTLDSNSPTAAITDVEPTFKQPEERVESSDVAPNQQPYELEILGGSVVSEGVVSLADSDCPSERFVAFPGLERAKRFGAGHLAVLECGLAAVLVTLGIAVNIQVQLHR